MTASPHGCVFLLAEPDNPARPWVPCSALGRRTAFACVPTPGHSHATCHVASPPPGFWPLLPLQGAVPQCHLGCPAQRLCNCPLQQVWHHGRGERHCQQHLLATAITRPPPQPPTTPSFLPFMPAHSDEERLRAHEDMNEHVLPGECGTACQLAMRSLAVLGEVAANGGVVSFNTVAACSGQSSARL